MKRINNPKYIISRAESNRECSSSRKLVIIFVFVMHRLLLVWGQGHCFCYLFYRYLKVYRAIHVRPHESCHLTKSSYYEVWDKVLPIKSPSIRGLLEAINEGFCSLSVIVIAIKLASESNCRLLNSVELTAIIARGVNGSL